MDVKIIKKGLTPEVGDIIEFVTPSENRDGSGFYLICKDNAEAEFKLKSNYFLINLNGKKGGVIKYYDTLKSLLEYHEGKYKLYSSNLFELAIMERYNN